MGEEDSLPEPQPHQHAQLLQLQQQHGQPEQPTPARPGSVQRSRIRVHEPDSSVRGKPAVRERASDRTRLSTPLVLPQYAGHLSVHDRGTDKTLWERLPSIDFFI